MLIVRVLCFVLCFECFRFARQPRVGAETREYIRGAERRDTRLLHTLAHREYALRCCIMYIPRTKSTIPERAPRLSHPLGRCATTCHYDYDYDYDYRHHHHHNLIIITIIIIIISCSIIIIISSSSRPQGDRVGPALRVLGHVDAAAGHLPDNYNDNDNNNSNNNHHDNNTNNNSNGDVTIVTTSNTTNRASAARDTGHLHPNVA